MSAGVCRGCRRGWWFDGEVPDAPCRWCGGEVRPEDEPGITLTAAVEPALDLRRAAQLLREAVERAPFPGPELASAADGLQLVWVPVWRVTTRVSGVVEATLVTEEPIAPSALEAWVPNAWSRREARPVRETRLRRVGHVELPLGPLWVDAHGAAPVAAPTSGPVADLAPGDAPVLLPSRSPRDQERVLAERVGEALGETLARAAGAHRATEVVWWPDRSPPGAPVQELWALVAVPVFVGWYRDQDGVVRTLTVDGTTGACGGPCLGSRAVAAAFAGRQTAIAAAVGLFGGFLALVGLLVWLLLPVSGAAGLLALRMVISARSAGPAVAAWNRRQIAP